jgi:hypothetical protein
MRLRRPFARGALVVIAAFVASTAGTGTAGRAWDGCTARSGDVRFRAADGTRLVGHRFGRGAHRDRPRSPEARGPVPMAELQQAA